MFDDGELAGKDFQLDSCCNFCKKKIKFMPLSSIDKKLKFCDVVCAKLYYDNVGKFEINKNEYNNYYNNDQLSKKAKEIYSKVGKIIFQQLPMYVPDGGGGDEAYGNPDLMKKKYMKILTPTLFK